MLWTRGSAYIWSLRAKANRVTEHFAYHNMPGRVPLDKIAGEGFQEVINDCSDVGFGWNICRHDWVRLYNYDLLFWGFD